MLSVSGPWLALVRSYAEQQLLCLFNLGDEDAELGLENAVERLDLVPGLGFEARQTGPRSVWVPAWGAAIAEISAYHGATRATCER